MSTTFELTWQEDNNRVPTQDTLAHLQAYLAWYLKALPMGQVTLTDSSGNPIGSPSGLWTCYYSCDGSTAGTAGDGVDRWTSTFTPSKIVVNSPGSAHSWFVLHSSALGIYVCIDVNNGLGSGGQYVSISMSKVAYTGGSTTARPTSTGEVISSTSFYGTANQTQIQNGNQVNHHVHGRIETGGQFIILFSRDGSGFANFACEVRALTETRSGETHNAWLFTEYNDSTGIYKRTAQLSVCSATSPVTASSGWIGRTADTTAVVNAGVSYPQVSIGAVNADIPSTDATDGKVGDDLMRLYASTTGAKSKRGRLQDSWWCHDAVAQASTEPTTGPPFVRAVIGNRLIPWHASVGPSL
jgi:hypothetical protein